MADIGQEIRLGPIRDDGAFAGQIQFDVLDFHRFQCLAQFRRGLLDLFLKLSLCFLQSIGHGVDAMFQYTKFTTRDDAHACIQMTGFQFAHGVGQAQYRLTDCTADS